MTQSNDLTLIFVALLVLKLTVRQDLLWTVVFAPYWFPIVIALVVIFIGRKLK